MSIIIAVDAMGGDDGSEPIVRGAVLAANANPVRVLLVGDEEQIRPLLAKQKYPKKPLMNLSSLKAARSTLSLPLKEIFPTRTGFPMLSNLFWKHRKN